MSGAIAPMPSRLGGAPPGRVAALRLRLRRFRPGRIVQAGLVALIGWGFFGSLVLGLGGQSAAPAAAPLWLAGAGAVAVVSGLGAALAGE